MYQIIKRFNANSKFYSGHPINKFLLVLFIFLSMTWLCLFSSTQGTRNDWDREIPLDSSIEGQEASLQPISNIASPQNETTPASNVDTSSNVRRVGRNAATASDSSPIPGTTVAETSGGEAGILARIAFYGDSQSDTDQEESANSSTSNLILVTGANPVFHLGDLLEDGTEDSLARFNRATVDLRNSRTFYAAQGNNERNSSLYFGNFIFPGNEHWYSVDVQNLHIIILDSAYSSTAVGSAQYNWLLNDLQNLSADKFAVAIFHHPPYGIGGDTKGLINTVVPIFRNLGVDLVISGHEHAYQKNIVDGVPYFVSSGQPLIGYFVAESYSSKIDLSYYNSSGTLIEKYVVANR